MHPKRYFGGRSVKQWAEYLGIRPNTLSCRLSRGWSWERALRTDVKDVEQNRARNGIKRCILCELPKDVSEFYTDANTHDGYRAQCKACNAALNKEQHERHKARDDANREAWRKANPDKVWAIDTRRSHKLKGQIIEVPTAELARMRKHQPVCGYCGKPVVHNKGVIATDSGALDRISDTPTNRYNWEDLILCCMKCSSTKGARPIEEFLSELPGADAPAQIDMATTIRTN